MVQNHGTSPPRLRGGALTMKGMTWAVVGQGMLPTHSIYQSQSNHQGHHYHGALPAFCWAAGLGAWRLIGHYHPCACRSARGLMLGVKSRLGIRSICNGCVRRERYQFATLHLPHPNRSIVHDLVAQTFNSQPDVCTCLWCVSVRSYTVEPLSAQQYSASLARKSSR